MYVNFWISDEIPSERCTAWEKYALSTLSVQRDRQIREDSVYHFPLGKPLAIDIVFKHADNRRRNIDKQISSILDLLEKAGIIENKRWRSVYEIHAVNEFSAAKASCSITIRWDNNEKEIYWDYTI